MWKDKSQCLRNRDKTKNMPTGSKPQTTYAIFHAKYLNNNCCFNYGNTGKLIHYTGPGTLSALNFSKIEFWSKGTGSGPWVMVDWEQGVYAGNIAKCGSGVPATAECTTTGENPNPSVTFDIVTTLFKHDGTDHWAAQERKRQAGSARGQLRPADAAQGGLLAPQAGRRPRARRRRRRRLQRHRRLLRRRRHGGRDDRRNRQRHSEEHRQRLRQVATQRKKGNRQYDETPDTPRRHLVVGKPRGMLAERWRR